MRFLSALLIFILSASVLEAQDGELRRHLEVVYSNWRTAVISRDLTGWQRATAAHRQMITRNLIVSQKQPFPAAMFAVPIQPPQLLTLRCLGLTSKGNTAHVAYFGKVDLGLVDAAEVPETLLILKFVREATGWKFDTTRLVNLTSAPDILAGLKNGQQATFLNDPEFAPTGDIPAIPKACPTPDRIGVLQIASFGYETKAAVNGFAVATVHDNDEEHLIIGGLRNGDNPLTLEVKETPVPANAERHLEINALVLTGNQERPTIRVFTWKPEGTTVAAAQKLMIHVNQITLR